MTITDGKITACTELELYSYWLARYDDIWPYQVYRDMMVRAGVEIVEDKQCDIS